MSGPPPGPPGTDRGDVAIVIAARDEADRIQATVKAAADIPGTGLLIVVDDGSRDGTAGAAESAGAMVLRHPRSLGKGAAMESGAEAVRLLERAEHRVGPRHLLFLDGDLAESAAYGSALAEPVRAGQADMTIAVFTERVRAAGTASWWGCRAPVSGAPLAGPRPSR